jgi:hypothetical protein
MDYSASIHDDNPAGSSPWGNSPSSSPRHDRTTFTSGATDPPPSFAFPPAVQSPGNGLSDEGGFASIDAGFQQPIAPSMASTTESIEEAHTGGFVTEHQPEQPQQAFRSGEQGLPPAPPQEHGHRPHDYLQHQGQHHGQAQQGQHHGQQGQQQPQPQHQQHQQQQQARRPQPQYKLQAKITGLERTGRKDPILRFDVHVRILTERKLPLPCKRSC